MPPQQTRSLSHRLLWFAGLWLAGVGTLALVSLVLHLWIAAK
jgi:hypothetical protein